MATYFSPNKVEEITVSLKVKMANGKVEHNREMKFTENDIGREAVIQLADLLLSSCDLAASIPNRLKESSKLT